MIFTIIKDDSKVCVQVEKGSVKGKLLSLFPQLRCHRRTSEEYAKEFILKKSAVIISLANSFRIPSRLLAAILYTEMTSSSLGFKTANAVSFLKTLIKGTDSSIGVGQVNTKHIKEWNVNMNARDAAEALYFKDDFGIAASARVLSEIYYDRIKRHSENYFTGFATTDPLFSIKLDRINFWPDVAEMYNSKSGNPYYRKAFLDSLRIIDGFFGTDQKSEILDHEKFLSSF